MSDSAFTNTLRMGRRLFHIDDLARLPMIFEAVAQVKQAAARGGVGKAAALEGTRGWRSRVHASVWRQAGWRPIGCSLPKRFGRIVIR
jgi:hypothetical protein